MTMMLSGCTVVRNAVKLKYPLEASLETYYPLCDEVVIAFDPTSEDETEAFVRSLSRRYPKIRAIPSRWNLENHSRGSEIAIQSNVAFQACRSEWVLYVQADEAIHEGDYEAIRECVKSPDVNGGLFLRSSFLGTLDREIPKHFTRDLLRLIRRTEGCVIEDGWTCGFWKGVKPRVHPTRWRMFNYSRMGNREDILTRSRSRDHFYIATREGVETNQKLEAELSHSARSYDPAQHPAAIRKFYGALNSAPGNRETSSNRSPVTLAFVVGAGDEAQVASLFRQLRQWPGDVVVLDNSPEGKMSDLLEHMFEEHLRLGNERVKILRDAGSYDPAMAGKVLHTEARTPWVFRIEPGEEWDETLWRGMPELVCQLERDGKSVCGFPRATFVDGVLANDVPESEWHSLGGLGALPQAAWPPRNHDIQYRLLRTDEPRTVTAHHALEGLRAHQDRVVSLKDAWILKNRTRAPEDHGNLPQKQVARKGRTSDELTRSVPLPGNLREQTLKEVVERLPPGRVVIVETGTLRDPSSEARIGDGWSTYTIAQCLSDRGIAGSRLYSIDIDPGCIDISKRTVAPDLHRWVSWICQDAAQAIRTLPVGAIDFLYLDSSDDPRHILAEFEAAQDKLAPHSIVVVDDTGPYHAGPDGKGTLVIPEALRQGWRAQRRDSDRCHMTVLTREPRSSSVRKSGVRSGTSKTGAGRG